MSQVSDELIQILRATLSDRADITVKLKMPFEWWVPVLLTFPSTCFSYAWSISFYTPEEQSLAAIFFRRWINREGSSKTSKYYNNAFI